MLKGIAVSHRFWLFGALSALLLLVSAGHRPPLAGRFSPSGKLGAAQDSLYVLAINGLNLRTAPGKHGSVITKIPYGERLWADSLFGEYAVPITNGFDIKGRWAKVHWREHSGYVFNGYLSNWPAPRRPAHSPKHPRLDLGIYYLTEKIGAEGPRVLTNNCGNPSNKDTCGWKQSFRRGAEIRYFQPDGLDMHIVSLPGASQQETYLLATALLVPNVNRVGTLYYNSEYRSIVVEPDSSYNCFFTIKKQEDSDIWTIESICDEILTD